MSFQIKQDIDSLARKVKYKKELEEKVQTLEKQKNSLQTGAVQLQLNLEKELERLQRLDRPSLENLLIAITGSKKSERRFLQANVDRRREKRQAAQSEIEKTRRQIEMLNAEITTLADCEEQYTQLINTCQNLSPQQTEQYISIRNGEIYGALNAGRKIMKFIDSIENSLKDAKFWSLLDIIGGRYSVWQDKYDRLDDANVQVTDLKTAVRDFKAHMKKVIIYIDYDFSISRLLMAADLMLDSMWADAAVKRKISGFQFEVADFRRWMEKLLAELENELT